MINATYTFNPSQKTASINLGTYSGMFRNITITPEGRVVFSKVEPFSLPYIKITEAFDVIQKFSDDVYRYLSIDNPGTCENFEIEIKQTTKTQAVFYKVEIGDAVFEATYNHTTKQVTSPGYPSLDLSWAEFLQLIKVIEMSNWHIGH